MLVVCGWYMGGRSIGTKIHTRTHKHTVLFLTPLPLPSILSAQTDIQEMGYVGQDRSYFS